MEIPLPYKLIIKKIDEKSHDKTMELREAKRLVAVCFRVQGIKVKRMLDEMRDMGLIKFENNRTIRILIVPD